MADPNNYIVFEGTEGNYASVPDDSSLDGTGTLECIVKVNQVDWTPAADEVWISKWDGSTGFLFMLESDGADLRFVFSDGAIRSAQATVQPTVSDGDWLWCRAVATEDGSARDVFFYTSTDTTNDPDLVTWTQLGDEVVIVSAAGNLNANTEDVYIGSQTASASTMDGSMAAAKINFAGATALDVNFTTLTAAEVIAASFTEDSANAATVTLTGSAWTYVRGAGGGMLLLGVG